VAGGAAGRWGPGRCAGRVLAAVRVPPLVETLFETRDELADEILERAERTAERLVGHGFLLGRTPLPMVPVPGARRRPDGEMSGLRGKLGASRGKEHPMGLTRTTGPLSAHAPATVNYRLDGPANKLLLHPFPRRVRAEVAGRTVLDTRRGVLLHETGLLPVLYVPEADLDATAFTPSGHTTHCPFKGDAGYRTLRVGDRVVENALWAYRDPLPAASWLAGLAALYWSAADAWFDEDEQVFAHLTDPYTRVDVRPTSRHVRVLAGEVVVAESHRPAVLTETGLPARWYLSPADVRVPIGATATRTRCPYKGEATYWTVRLPGGRELVDAAWSYPEPLPESGRIAGLLSFAHDGLAVEVDGEPA